MAIPTAPSNMNDFMAQASSFVTNARAKGIDDSKIANTIKFMYGLTQQNIVNSQKDTEINQDEIITPYQQAQLDLEGRRLDNSEQGTFEYNSDTGQYFNPTTRESFAAPNSDTTITSSDFGVTAPQVSSNATPAPAKSTFDPAAFDQAWKPTTKNTAPETLNMSVETKKPSTETWRDKYQSPNLLGSLSSLISGGANTSWKPAKYGQYGM